MKAKNKSFLQNLAMVSMIYFLVFMGSCNKQSTMVEFADLIIKNGKIMTVDPALPMAEAIAVKGEIIVAVGSYEAIKRFFKSGFTQEIDAQGCLVTPGFNDAHIHFLSGGYSLLNLDFRYISDIKIIREMVKKRVAQVEPGQLIKGRSWDHELFPDKKWPTKKILDEVAPDNPVILSRTDGHSVWVNSYVLRKTGITRDTKDPFGGTIVRDGKTGEATGILKEAAIGLIKVGSYDAQDEKGKFKRDYEAFLKALQRARETGVTSIQHLNNNIDIIQKLKDEGKLTLRVTFNMWLTKDKAQLEEYKTLRTKYPRENTWIRFGYLKDFIDGTLGSGTALMFEPFTDDPTTKGLAQMPYQELEEKVVLADSLGFQIGIHAIGTQGNNWILNAYEKAARVNGSKGMRHRSEHAQILTAQDINRFAELEVIASMQPTHCITDKNFAEKRLGLERCQGAYAWQSLLAAGAKIAFGTDWPVEPMDPVQGLYASVTRKDRKGEAGSGWFPEQKLTLAKTIELYTLGSAYAEFSENQKGSLKKGKLADIVIFDRDLLSIPPDNLLKAKVDFTIVGGKVVFRRKN